jgi:hypothetical protein
MSHPSEKLCQCGYAVGFPGPPQALLDDGSMIYFHDMPHVDKLLLVTICPCCSAPNQWEIASADVRQFVKMKLAGAPS